MTEIRFVEVDTGRTGPCAIIIETNLSASEIREKVDKICRNRGYKATFVAALQTPDNTRPDPRELVPDYIQDQLKYEQEEKRKDKQKKKQEWRAQRQALRSRRR